MNFQFPTIPPWKELVIGPDGLMTRPWRTYFERLDTLARGAPDYGAALPDPTGIDGRLFVLTTGPALYQLQAGAWVAL